MELIIILLSIIAANIVLGTVKAIGNNFSFSKFGEGALDAIKTAVAVFALHLGYIYLTGIEFIGMVYSPIAFFFLGLTGVYYMNSCLRNISMIIFKTEDIQILKELDEWFKQKLGHGIKEIVDDPGLRNQSDLGVG